MKKVWKKYKYIIMNSLILGMMIGFVAPAIYRHSNMFVLLGFSVFLGIIVAILTSLYTSKTSA